MNQLEQFREQCAKICDEYREAMIKENEEDLYWFGKVKNAYGAASGAKELAKKIRALPLPEISDTPVAYIRCRYAQSLNTNGHCDGHEWMEVCNEGEQGEDGEPAFPVYATPRPYIPQDIRETVEENEALRAALEEIHSWVASIATAKDMAQNFPHIEEVCAKALRKDAV